MAMKFLAERLDMYLTMTGREQLTNIGSISHKKAEDKIRLRDPEFLPLF